VSRVPSVVAELLFYTGVC